MPSSSLFKNIFSAKYLSCIVFFSFIICLEVKAYAYRMDFEKSGDTGGWYTDTGGKLSIKEGSSLRTSGNGRFKVFSPAGIASPKKDVFRFRIKADEGGFPAYINFITEDGRHWKTSFIFGTPYKFNTYSIDTKNLIKTDSKIDSFNFSFAGVNEVYFAWAGFEEKTFTKTLIESFQELMEVNDLSGLTINTIEAPRFGRISINSFLYMLFLLMLIPLSLVLRKKGVKKHIQKACMLSAIIIFFMFTIRMDYKWFLISMKDNGIIKEAGRKELMSILKGDEYKELAVTMRQIIPIGEKVRIISDSDPFLIRTRYFLLPVLVSEEASYILVYDGNTRYIRENKTILKDSNVIERDVEFLGSFENGSQLYRKLPSLEKKG